MTIYYVDSAAGSNTAPYDTWGKAATKINTIAALSAAGDIAYVASTHNESNGISVSWNWAGTATSPCKIICADKTSGAPPSTIATGGTVTMTSGGLNMSLNNAVLYIYGITASAAATSGAALTPGTATQLDSCSLLLTGSSGSASINASGSNWKNCSVKFGAVGQLITAMNVWSGGSLLSGGTTPTTLFSGAPQLVENIDLSNAAATIGIFATAGTNLTRVIRNILLPAAWTGSLNTVTPSANTVLVLNNCDSAGTNYILHRQTQFGDVYSETGVVRSGGATDGVTPLSWKMVSLTASGTFPITTLNSGEIHIWNNDTSAKTLTVEFIHDNVTGLDNSQIWVEVDYYGASGNPQGSLASSAMTNVLSTPSTYNSSSVTWNGTGGMSNPNKQKMTVTFTPQLKGMLIITIKLCKSNYTVYVDPPQFASLS